MQKRIKIMKNIYISDRIKLVEVLLPRDCIVVNNPKLADIHILHGKDKPINKEVTIIVLHGNPKSKKWINLNCYFVETATEVCNVISWR